MGKAIYDLIAGSRESYETTLLIYRAVNKFDFNTKAWEVFRDKIFNLVKKILPDAEYIDEGKGEDEWNCIDIPIGHDCKLRVNYDMKSITVESDNPKKIDKGTLDKIRKIMLDKSGSHDMNWGEGFYPDPHTPIPVLMSPLFLIPNSSFLIILPQPMIPFLSRNLRFRFFLLVTRRFI